MFKLLIIRGIQNFLKLLNNSLYQFNRQELGSWIVPSAGGFEMQRETGMSVSIGERAYGCSLLENNLISWSNQYRSTQCPPAI